MTSPPANESRHLPLMTQLTRFGIIGVCTVGLDFGILYLLVHFGRLSYLVSAMVAFVTASTVNYILSVQYVFLAGRFGRAPEFTIFMVTTLVGLGLNEATMWALVGVASINYMLAKCVSLILVTTWNFVSKKRIVFLD